MLPFSLERQKKTSLSLSRLIFCCFLLFLLSLEVEVGDGYPLEPPVVKFSGPKVKMPAVNDRGRVDLAKLEGADLKQCIFFFSIFSSCCDLLNLFVFFFFHSG